MPFRSYSERTTSARVTSTKLTRREVVTAMAVLPFMACERATPRAEADESSGAGAGASARPTARTARTARMPVGFVGHGAPLVALDPDKGAAFAAWGAALEKPRAVLAISAHWYAREVALGTETTRPLMYDFGGFPDALYHVAYPAPGAPDVATRVAALLGDAHGLVRHPDRALDHGVWTPLVHMWRAADVPVLQLSLPRHYDASQLYALGAALAPLRDEGVFIMASGNLTHNLRRILPDGAEPEAFARDFDAWIRDVLVSNDHAALLAYRERAPDFAASHPTEEHFVPLLVAAGAAGFGDEGVRVRFPVEGFEYGNLSRRAVELS